MTAAPPRDLAALTTAWEAAGIDAATLAAEPDGTLSASDRRITRAGSMGSFAGMERHRALPMEPLELRALLGEGGMGEVHLAWQRALRREVAVKIAQKDRSGAAEALLKEAWVGALVEHPNVVPVHALVRVSALGEATGLVMKRIVGRSWAKELAEPVLASSAGTEAPLEWNLRVLVRVCQAVAFAHSRGVVHLDLKPENVMVGDHGEVYVLDWGLAAGVGEHAPPWLGRAADIRRVAGTPGYMAPELAAADASRIDERTDVYLLGAVLHHVLTGTPLHRGESLMALLGAAFASVPPAYGPEVPEELAQIVVRATSFDPSARFPSAIAFKSAVEAFLRHRPAERLVRRVEAQLAVIAGLTRASAEPGGGPTADDATIEPALAEADVALEEARRSWAEHPRLVELEAKVGQARLEHALRRMRPAAARTALAHIRDREAHRVAEARVRALEADVAAREAHVRALEGLERDLDLAMGTAARSRLWTALGVAWGVTSCVFELLERAGWMAVSYAGLLVQCGLLIAFFLPFAWLQRRTLFANRAHRRLYAGVVITAIAVEVLFGAGMLHGLPVRTSVALTSLFYVYAFATLTIAVDRRIAPATLVLVVMAAAIGLWPGAVHAWLGLGGLGAALATAHAWARQVGPTPARP